MFTVVSYYTRGTPYMEEAEKLRASLEALHIPHRIYDREHRGGWVENCAQKADVIADAFWELKTPVLWVDADAIIQSWPMLFDAPAFDFAIYREEVRNEICGPFRSGTVYFGQTERAWHLLNLWRSACRADAGGKWDQVHLFDRWNGIMDKPETHWLPLPYCQKFDEDGGNGAVIVHTMASRRLKGEIDRG